MVRSLVSMRRHRPARASAFTLIELLVVIAIISILAAILFPVFAQARAKARQSACLSNLKQLTTASLMYVQDYDEQFMEIYRNHEGTYAEYWPAYFYPHPTSGYRGWFTAPSAGMATPNWAFILQPYIKNEAVFDCPDGKPLWVPSTPTDAMGYAYSNYIADSGITANPAMPLAQIPRPADTIVFFETGNTSAFVQTAGWQGAVWIYPNTSCASQTDIDPNYTCPSCFPYWKAPHQGGRHFAFADGHVKWAKDTQMWVRQFPEKWVPQCQK
jgi:prepilin-type N-terminal cleavage/methylation domain-containing protein/prepilin-type processing-associated H-X9-DG protein